MFYITIYHPPQLHEDFSIIVVGDLLDEPHNVQPLEFINDHFKINIKQANKHFLKFQDMTELLKLITP